MISIRDVRWPVSSRNVDGPDPGQAQGQLGHGVGHGDGVHGHVVEVDDRGRALGRGPHEGRGHLVGGDPLQQVGGVDDQVGVESGGAGHRAGGLLDEQGEPVGGGRVGLALEQPGQQEVPLLPADELLVGLDVAAAGQQAPGLELDEDGGHHQELGQDLQVDLGPTRPPRPRRRRPRRPAGCRRCPPGGC